jgi:hypothetical protein
MTDLRTYNSPRGIEPQPPHSFRRGQLVNERIITRDGQRRVRGNTEQTVILDTETTGWEGLRAVGQRINASNGTSTGTGGRMTFPHHQLEEFYRSLLYPHQKNVIEKLTATFPRRREEVKKPEEPKSEPSLLLLKMFKNFNES